MHLRLILLVSIIFAIGAQAAPLRFESASLKYLYQVTLTIKGDTAKGVFERSEYGFDRVKYPFTAKAVPTAKGKSGTSWQVSFNPKEVAKKGAPYNYPPGGKPLVWRLVETKEGQRLVVTFINQVYTTPTTWKVFDVEFEPADKDR